MRPTLLPLRGHNSGQQQGKKKKEKGKKKSWPIVCRPLYQIFVDDRLYGTTNLGRINRQLPANERSPRNWVSLIISLIILSPFHSKRIRAISYFKESLSPLLEHRVLSIFNWGDYIRRFDDN